MATTNELFDPIGRVYSYKIETHPNLMPFTIKVKVLDTRKRLFHGMELLITPEQGHGVMWVSAKDFGFISIP